MSKYEKIICEKCGCEMIPLDSEPMNGMTCPNCGWGWVTSFFAPYEIDKTIYSVSISDNAVTKDMIRIISNIANVNYLQAKKLIEATDSIIFEGKAQSVLSVKKELTEACISFKITPDFPY